jgi:hypothetical protein
MSTLAPTLPVQFTRDIRIPESQRLPKVPPAFCVELWMLL